MRVNNSLGRLQEKSLMYLFKLIDLDLINEYVNKQLPK